MDGVVEMHNRDHERPHIRRESIALLVSLLSLVLAGWSLFETSLRQPRFNVYVGPFGEYARPNTNDEIIMLPLTFSNSGARSGAIISMKLIVTNDRQEEKQFVASDIVTSDNNRTLFAPVAIQGHGEYSSKIQFTSPGKFIVDAGGAQTINVKLRYSAKLLIRTAYNESFGVFDYLMTTPPPETQMILALDRLDVGYLVSGPSDQIKRVERVNVEKQDETESSDAAHK